MVSFWLHFKIIICVVDNSGSFKLAKPFATLPPLLDNNVNRKIFIQLTILKICTSNEEVKFLMMRIYRSSHCGCSEKKDNPKNSCSGTF